MNQCRRTTFFVDREVQGSLLLRTAVYWLFCLLSVALMLICWAAYNGPPRRFADLATDQIYRYGPALFASLILLPIVLMDVLRVSNRFVGPITRLRGALKTLANGQPAKPLNFRDEDFWRELATDFNQVAARVARADIQLPPPTELIEDSDQGADVTELAGVETVDNECAAPL
jgi:hypothetical protein